MNNEQAAREILNQLGGYNRLHAMVGIDNMLSGDNAGNQFLQFTFQGSRKANRCKIELTPLDLYTVGFYKVTRKGFEKVAGFDSVYCDNLVNIFESTTGLYLSI